MALKKELAQLSSMLRVSSKFSGVMVKQVVDANSLDKDSIYVYVVCVCVNVKLSQHTFINKTIETAIIPTTQKT